MIPGVTVNLGGQDLVAAPANLRSVRAWMQCRQAHEFGTVEHFDGMVAFILSTLQRNHPELNAEFILDNVDNRSLPELMRAVSGTSGLKTPVVPGEGSGESIGTPSTST